jgi:hypothetical protein
MLLRTNNKSFCVSDSGAPMALRADVKVQPGVGYDRMSSEVPLAELPAGAAGRGRGGWQPGRSRAPRNELAQAIENAKPGKGPDDFWATTDLDVNDDGVVDKRDLDALDQLQVRPASSNEPAR